LSENEKTSDGKRLRVLLSNDDGIDAPGLKALEDAFKKQCELWVVAPNTERSAASHCISLNAPLRVEERGERCFAVDGTPVDCVYIALNHIMDAPPDLVLAGINMGANLGTDILYSGTVGAAMEGAVSGIPAVALSLALTDNHKTRPSEFNFSPAIAYVQDVMTKLASTRGSNLGVNRGSNNWPDKVTLNVNIPNCEAGEEPEREVCSLGFVDWAHSVHVREDPRGKPYYWVGGERRHHPNGENKHREFRHDIDAIADGKVSITPIHYDLTAYDVLKSVAGLHLANR